MKKTSVKTKLVTVTLIIAFVGMALIAVTGYAMFRRAILDESIKKIQNIATSEAERINGWIEAKKTVVQSVGAAVYENGTRGFIQSVTVAEAKIYGDLLTVYAGFSDDTGVFSANTPDFNTWKATRRGWYMDAMAKRGEIVLTSPYLDAGTGGMCATISQYIGVVEGQDAVFAVDVDVEYLVQVVSHIKVTGHNDLSYAFLTDANGEIASHPNQQFNPTPSKNFQMDEHPVYRQVYNTLKNGGAYVLLNDYDGVERYFIPKTIGETGWVLYIAAPSSDIMRPVNDLLSYVLIMVPIVMAVAAIIFYFAIKRMVADPLKELQNAAAQMADGNLSYKFSTNRRDEIGALINQMGAVADVFASLENEVKEVHHSFDELGDMDARLNDVVFKGEYRLMCARLNTLLDSIIHDLHYAMDINGKFAAGVFDMEIISLPGKKAELTDALRLLAAELNSVNEDVRLLTQNARRGNLEFKIDTSHYNASWKDMTQGLNDMMKAFVEPLRETAAVVAGMAKGDFSVQMAGAYEGEYLKLKGAVNSTIGSVSAYISEISQVLGQMAGKNFDVDILNDYVGDFEAIKNSLNLIISSLSGFFENINVSGENVASGTHHLGESGTALAEGAVRQTTEIAMLVQALDGVNKDTTDNVAAAIKAKDLAFLAKTGTDNGMGRMGALMESMRDINDASGNIVKIINVIEDISFQTNLLALNAAVEAARAGQHGKGFTVVAEEVRNLAGKSKDSAQDTRVLIESTIEKVSAGMKLANETSEMLSEIVSQIGDISQIISNLTDASNKQADSIHQINQNIARISDVVQSNSATSEEVAASSTELAAQADTLKNEISKFKLKKVKSSVNIHTPAPTIIKQAETKPAAPVIKSVEDKKPAAPVTVNKPAPPTFIKTGEIKPSPKFNKPATPPVAKPGEAKQAPPKFNFADAKTPVIPAKPAVIAPVNDKQTETPEINAPAPKIKLNPNTDYHRKDFGKY